MGWPPYQVVLRLIAVAEDNWPEIDATYPQVDLIRLPLHRLLNFIYGWLVRHANHEQKEELNRQLLAPLVTESGRVQEPTPMTEEEEGQMFMATMRQLKGN